jgi:hypothetical protein
MQGPVGQGIDDPAVDLEMVRFHLQKRARLQGVGETGKR